MTTAGPAREVGDQHLEAVPFAPGTVDVSVLVPVKDEVASLAQLTAEIVAALETRQADEIAGDRFEVVFVDDGSTDGSWDEIVRLGSLDPRIRGLRLRRNLGKSAALAVGVASSSGPVLATLDGDLQDDPAELPAMIARLTDADFVAGHKAERKDPLGKRLPSRVFNAVTGLVTGLKLHDHNCGLKVARREVFTSVPLYGEMHRYLASISHAQGFRVVEQRVHHRPRLHGRSKFGLERYARGGLDLLTVLTLTRYSRRPAHLFGGVGLVVGAVGMVALLYLTGVWFLTDQPVGGRPLLLMGVLFVILAVQLMSLGLIAEMIISRDALAEDPLRQVVDRTGPPA
jgi:glycosyltransferase involved in cell wall biosynthesis